MINRDLIIDCFAGGGGASVGIEMALGRPVDIAINHDIQAIRIHKVNHPSTLHLTEDIFKVDLQKYVGGRHVALMWASPDCTSHSKAKGGQPRKKGLRILPWAVYKHAKAILPDVIIMENVEEIQQWGPLDPDGHPIPERKGEDYRKFVSSMQSLGYAFDSRELVAADYGAPTTRKRWYAIFRRDGKAIVWPEPTHSKSGIVLPRWKQCGDYIDWSNLGKSIFDRKKPLADATMARIANGIQKYIIDNPHPYIVNDKRAIAFLIQYHSETKKGDARGQTLREPIKTIDTSNRYGLVTAFITKFYKTGIGQGCDEPIHTITTSPGHFGLVSAFFEIDGEEWIIADIFLRMLNAAELKLMQGFPPDYILERDISGKAIPVKERVAKIGNSVVPIMAEALVAANCPYLIVGERIPNMMISTEQTGQLRFA